MDPTPEGTRYGVPAHRKKIVDQLTQAYGSDMLEQRDFERRLEKAESATTIEELNAVVADFGAAPRPASAVPTTWERRVTLLGNQSHVLTPATGEALKAMLLLGNLNVDLTAFRGSGRTVNLHFTGGLGEVRVRVPEGTRVIRRVQVLVGDFRTVQARQPGVVVKLFQSLFGGRPQPVPVTGPGGPPPTVVIDGWWGLGNVTVREELP